jgi:hypothetical protein
VVERRARLLDAAVGEAGGQELDQRGLIAGVERARLQVTGALGVGEVAAAGVERDDVGQRRLAAVVEVRKGAIENSSVVDALQPFQVLPRGRVPPSSARCREFRRIDKAPGRAGGSI